MAVNDANAATVASAVFGCAAAKCSTPKNTLLAHNAFTAPHSRRSAPKITPRKSVSSRIATTTPVASGGHKLASGPGSQTRFPAHTPHTPNAMVPTKPTPQPAVVRAAPSPHRDRRPIASQLAMSSARSNGHNPDTAATFKLKLKNLNHGLPASHPNCSHTISNGNDTATAAATTVTA